MDVEELTRKYQGQMVPQSYNVKFVVLSFVVSLIGASSTLELINRRTGSKGLFNHLLLVSSAVTMGGVSIWCMHFVGNQAIDLANGEPRLQIAYSGSFTALSFFVPILVLAAAFMAVGSNNKVSWWRISSGGTLCGGAVCGMHYLGNASIANYACIYHTVNVIGAALIAVAASTVALSLFFIFRSIWANSWWKRIASAVILAAAVSGMHWVAAVGTRYKLVTIEPAQSEVTRRSTVIVVICLSVAACFVIAGSAIFKARNLKKHADRAQKVTLGAAIFDQSGRILVDTDGLIPSTVITDSYPEKNNEEFGIAHPAFHWMFQATKDWSSISSLLASMKNHLDRLPNSRRAEDGQPRVDLTNSFGEPIEHYNAIFKELFCVAAGTLAERLREPIASVGTLWDEVLPTGIGRQGMEFQNKSPEKGVVVTVSPDDATEQSVKGDVPGQPAYGRGSLMFLVRHVEDDNEVDRLTSLGYRFAHLHHVASGIGSRMQIQSPATEAKLRQMAAYAEKSEPPCQGVSVCFFGIKARVNRSGFDVVVQKGAQNLLPAVSLPIERLEPWHLGFLRQSANNSVANILVSLEWMETAKATPREKAFARQFSDALKSLKKYVQDRFIDDAVLTLDVLNVSSHEQQAIGATQLLALRVLIPVHTVLVGSNCEFIPLTFLKVQQPSQQQQLDFAQSVHREFEPIIRAALDHESEQAKQRAGASRKLWWERAAKPGLGSEVSLDVNQMPSGRRSSSPRGSIRSASTVDLCQHDTNGGNVSQFRQRWGESATLAPEEADTSQSFGGILVSQEITIDVEAAGRKNDTGSSDQGPVSSQRLAKRRFMGMSPTTPPISDIEMNPVGEVRTDIRTGRADNMDGQGGASNRAVTFLDVLFEQCVEGRYD